MSERKAIVKNADMPEEVQQKVVDTCQEAMEKYTLEKDIATHVKKFMDEKYGPTWHCVVGKQFGSYVTHESNNFIYFYLDQSAILLFKSG
ncbi:unnamed protein product [Dicrocoelium dendriticum]|nr:unnamed protein product [Dicrocoelium dendriticum]